MFSRRSRRTFLRFSFCSLVRFFGTIFVQFSARPVPRSKCHGRFGDSQFNSLTIILSDIDQT
jgi:hypothetical protein